ncbi:UNVERIFIED_CONTAM: hypothetical protein GTU68_044696 [Idotea baltica]|nr:hypothetical protein [Idotea baltica]
MYFYVILWMGLSDHEGGLLMLLLTAVLMMSLNSRSKSLCLEVGGAKRFNAFSWLVSFILLTPCVLLFWIMKVSSPVDALSSFHLIFIIALLYVVFHYYVNMTCNQKLTPAKASQIGTITLLLSSLVLGFVWPQREQEFHRVSGGAVFSLILFSIATMQLTSSSEFMTLDQDDLLPFHYFSTDVLERSPSFFAFMNSTFHTVMTDPNSRIIFYFLCINLGFTFVELSYGMFTNSLGLISDGFHMLFDCSALVMGLTASVMTQWKPTKKFPFGYGRIEVLSGFVNGLFLSVIGLMVFVEAVERLLEPPPIRTERLLAVAVCGLVVNLCGIFAFSSHSHGHSHGGGSHSHGGSHGHSHHGHSHAQKSSHGHSHNANMEGVFLHILADTLGSVAVIISSFLIDWYGWLIADPICSLILSVLILASVFPLLKNSALVLLLGAPPHLQEGVRPVIDKILEIESVLKCESPHFWRHCDNITVATINVCISGDIPEQKIMQKVSSILQDFGFSHITVEIEVSKSTSNWVSTAPSSHGLGTIIKSVPKNQNEDFFSI